MRDRNAPVTPKVTRDSQYPVPTRPVPSRPALYRGFGSPSTTSSLSYARGSAAAVEVAPLDDVVTGESLIEGINLDAEVPCGHSEHATRHLDEPAAYIIRVTHLECGAYATYPICESGWLAFVQSRAFRCVICSGVQNAPVEQGAVRIVEVLR